MKQVYKDYLIFKNFISWDNLIISLFRFYKVIIMFLLYKHWQRLPLYIVMKKIEWKLFMHSQKTVNKGKLWLMEKFLYYELLQEPILHSAKRKLWSDCILGCGFEWVTHEQELPIVISREVKGSGRWMRIFKFRQRNISITFSVAPNVALSATIKDSFWEREEQIEGISKWKK